ncbi:Tll0287-like domain-containing protein [Cecembia lonarensis]|uniref:Tll0287-like domain-containing protein n=1 Tax=Cecembia lonarensis (strain CCUG 58316 / KCTC 22772 / LW9) TaxID=1225176 RepID=K1LGF2_CECL9|nr:DUF3365 domain-containing protein [Cecembia lonarensis]EKB49343.1 hypothetical protein B879_02003 [Cecembia lonarensis LW9]
MKKIFYFLILLSIIVSCGTNERVSKEVFDEVNKSMEVKKVNEADVLKKALEWGEEISQSAQEQLISALQNAISEKGIPGAIEFCQVEALPILREVGEKYNVEIRRASNAYRNPEDKPRDYEEMILEAFEYNTENELPTEANIQKLEGGEVLLYAKAIKIPNALCLNCHGNPGADISEETLEKLDKLYPEDKARGHQMGDLRGMWSIRIPKKEIVKQL